MNYQVTESLQKISRWGKILGYVFMIVGAILAIGGAFPFVIPAIPGVLQIFLGLYLYRSAKEADKMLHHMDENAMGELLSNYAKFLKMNGILMIISLVFMMISFIIFGALFFQTLSTL